MKKTGGLFLQILRITGILFVILFLYALVNSFIITLLGGMDAVEGTFLFSLFFFLQAGAVFLLITVYYRNKIQFVLWQKGEHQKPLSQKLTRRLILISTAGIAVSYIILIVANF